MFRVLWLLGMERRWEVVLTKGKVLSEVPLIQLQMKEMKVNILMHKFHKPAQLTSYKHFFLELTSFYYQVA